MNVNRRLMLKGATATGALAIAAGAGLLAPRAVLAAWPKAAFEAKSMEDALNGATGSSEATASDKVKIKAPDIAENGAVVPITVSTTLDGVESISLIAKENPSPLTSTYMLGAGAEGYVSTRIKMGKTSDVIAVVKAGGKLYSATKEVKVTIGGCGG
jgi:sulfur-oxidizing protein SoxY